MNILEFLKNGSGIHIKEKNKGKFTSYCGGKVTDECIRKAKASGNPTLVKRATFADNARHWKHEKGGKAFVKGVNILDSNPNIYRKKRKFQEGGKNNGAPSTKFLSKQWFKNIGNDIGDFMSSKGGLAIGLLGTNLLGGYLDYKNSSKLLDSQLESSKASLELTYLSTIQEAMLNKIIRQQQLKDLWKLAYLSGETTDNYSDVVASHMGWEEYAKTLLNAEQLKNQQLALLDSQVRNAKNNMMGNLIGSIGLLGLGILSGIFSSSKTASNGSPSNNSVKV